MVVPQVSSPTFIGRRTELGLLQEAVERAVALEPRPILLAGEAGVGKTRLLEELGEWAKKRGCRVLVGGCVSLSADVAPFAPIIEALRPLKRDLPTPTLGEVVGNGQNLASLMSDVELIGDPIDSTGVSPDTTQVRLFEQLLGMLERLSALAPVVLIVEDIHWADRSTVDVLAFLARNIRTQPVQLVATFRSDQPEARRQLLPFISEFGRQPNAQRIDLTRFNRAEVAEQLSAITGRPVAAATIDGVYRRSQGNPFFSEELLLSGSTGDAMPETLRDVLRARVAALGHDAEELVRVASAAGRQFSESVLRRLTEVDENTLRAALREVLDHQILVRRPHDGDERLAFRHALIQEVVYGDLLPSERMRTHAACAQAIEEQLAAAPDATLASELAYHWQAADEPERALQASIVAGMAAEATGAQREAALQYERALELMGRVRAVDPQLPLDRVQLLERAAANQLENPSRAVEHIQSAIKLTDSEADPVGAGLLYAALGRYLWFTGDGAAALAACREAVRLVPEDPPSVARARVMAGLGQILMILTHSEEAVAITTDAVRLAGATEARTIESHALNTLGLLRAYLGDVDGGLAMLRRALEIATEVGSVDDIGRAWSNLQDVLIVAAARFDEAAETGLRALNPANEAAVVGIWTALAWTDVAWAQYLAGRWDEALASLKQARLQAAEGVAEIEWEIRTAQVLVGRGQFDEAARHLDRLDSQLEGSADTQWIAPAAAARAEYAIWTGDATTALQSISDGLARTQLSFGANVSRIGPLLALGIRAAADVVDVHRARRSSAPTQSPSSQAEGHMAQMQGIRDEIAARWPALLRLAEPFHALCRAELTRLEGRSDPGAWANSADLFESLPLPYTAAYARFREGEASMSGRAGTRDAARARAALGNALAIATTLGAEPLRDVVEAAAKRGGLDLTGDEPRKRSAGAAGLTSREQEIVGLLADGLTNREIGDRLFITEKTASHHVSNVLAKLHVRSRAEAAVEAIRLGIAKPPH